MKQQKLIILMMPIINVIAMNILQYMDGSLISNNVYNWGLQFAVIIGGLFFYIIHYILAFCIPVILYRRTKIMTTKDGLLACNSMLIANVLMVILEIREANIDYFPQYMMATTGITMCVVIIVSLLLVVKCRREGKSNSMQ